MDKMDSFPLKLAIRGVQGQKIDYYNTECYGKMQKGVPTQTTVPFHSSLFGGPDLWPCAYLLWKDTHLD